VETLGTYSLCFSHSSLRPCRTASLGGNIFYVVVGEQGLQTKGSPTTYTLISFLSLYFDEIVLDLYANISLSHLATTTKKNKKKCSAIKSFQQ